MPPKKADMTNGDDLPPLPIAAPNGGWGWVVVAASFFSNLLVDGVLYTFGIFLVALIDTFHSSRTSTALVGSLLGGTYLIVGPIVSALVNKFGCRPVTICGSILSSASFFISTYSTSIAMMTFVYGILGGIGFGMMYLPSIVMVGLYFDTKRAMATGIALCGSGVGTMMFAPIARALLDEYGWRGANKILAGICLNGIACGLVYRPLTNQRPPRTTKDQNQPSDLNPVQSSASNEDNPIVPAVPRSVERITNTHQLASSFHSVNRLKSSSNVQSKPNIGGSLNVLATDSRSNQEIQRPLSRQDIFYQGSVTNINEFKASPDMQTYVQSVTTIPELEKDGSVKKEGVCTPVSRVLKTMFDFSLMKSPTFLIICLSGIFGFIGFFTPFVYLNDYGLGIGMSPDSSSLLVSVIGLANIIGRLLFGYLADRPWMDSVMLHNVATMICGLSTCLVPLCLLPGLLFTYAAVFGFTLSAYITLRSIVICDLLGVQKLTNAFGLLALFQGIALLSGTPFSGFLYDSTGSYTISFIVAGTILALGGAVCIPARRIKAWEDGRKQRVNRNNNNNKTTSGYKPVGLIEEEIVA